MLSKKKRNFGWKIWLEAKFEFLGKVKSNNQFSNP